MCGCNLNSRNLQFCNYKTGFTDPVSQISVANCQASRQPNLSQDPQAVGTGPQRGLLACWLQPAERADPDTGSIPPPVLRGLHHCRLTDVTEAGPPALWGPAVPWTCSPEPLSPLQTPLCCPSLSGFSWLNGRCSFPKVMPGELGPTTKLPKPQVLQLFHFTPTLPCDTFKSIAGAALWPMIWVFQSGPVDCQLPEQCSYVQGHFPHGRPLCPCA